MVEAQLSETTQLLRAWGQGDPVALERLTPRVYDLDVSSASCKPKTQEHIEKLDCGERENWSRIACKDESLLACRRFREELEAEHGKV